MRTDRPAHRALLALHLAAVALGCGADPAPHPGAAAPARSAAPPPPSSGPATEPTIDYLLAEPEHRAFGTSIALDASTWGVLLEGARAVTTDTGITLAAESTDTPILRVDRLPPRLGAGFLFRTSRGLYTAATFDGPLRALATLPSPITRVSFGPTALLVRADTGERWMIDAATGARSAPSPLGLIDVAGLDDGRFAAVVEAGGAFISTDAGKSWQDVRARLRGEPGGVEARDGELWIIDRQPRSTRALRVERDGALADIGAPTPPPPPKPDARLRDGASPVRAALTRGARVGPWAAAVASGGDILYVDLSTSTVTKTIAGVLPQNMECDAVSVPDDVLFVCAQQSGSSAVVSGVLRGKEPRVERSFNTDGPWFEGEDGALAISGPCTSPDAATLIAAAPSACIRNASGQWETFSLKEEAEPAAAAATATSVPTATPAATATTSGPPRPQRGPDGAKPLPAPNKNDPRAPQSTRIDPRSVRWIPRPGRPPIAILPGSELASHDTAWGETRPWQMGGLPSHITSLVHEQAQLRRGPGVLDRRWSATSKGELRAILRNGRGVEISTDGTLTAWPFEFDQIASSGARAFARSREGRAFQTLDFGRTWAEVMAPPMTGASVFEPRACSSLGCDLKGFLRVGWEATAPRRPPPPKKIAAAPMPQDAPLVEMACVAAGSSEARSATSTNDSPFDFALGASRLSVPPDFFSSYVRRVFSRAPVNVALGRLGDITEIAPRAVLHGFPFSVVPSERTDSLFGEIEVEGPSRAASSLRRELMFVEPLVPGAPLRRVSFGLDAIARVIKPLGVTPPQIAQLGGLDPVAVVPVMPAPGARAAGGDVLVSLTVTDPGTLYVRGRGGSTPRADVLFAQPGGVAQSAAELASGDLVVLVVTDAGGERLLRFSASGVAELGDIPAPPETTLAPANPDAIAIGPRGEIAVIRAPSGAEPASASDPALLITAGMRVTPLAPWASALPASDPACASDADGFRATIQTIGPWVRVAGKPLPDDAESGMTARVRWSAARLCVEALEVPESAGLSVNGAQTETIVVATFAPGPAPGVSGRAGVELGAEARAPLSCALAPR